MSDVDAFLPKDLANIVKDYHCNGITFAICRYKRGWRHRQLPFYEVELYTLYGLKLLNFEIWSFEVAQVNMADFGLAIQNGTLDTFVKEFGLCDEGYKYLGSKELGMHKSFDKVISNIHLYFEAGCDYIVILHYHNGRYPFEYREIPSEGPITPFVPEIGKFFNYVTKCGIKQTKTSRRVDLFK